MEGNDHTDGFNSLRWYGISLGFESTQRLVRTYSRSWFNWSSNCCVHPCDGLESGCPSQSAGRDRPSARKSEITWIQRDDQMKSLNPPPLVLWHTCLVTPKSTTITAVNCLDLPDVRCLDWHFVPIDTWFNVLCLVETCFREITATNNPPSQLPHQAARTLISASLY